MAKVTITLEDTPEGLVSVDTEVVGYDPDSHATQMASSINEYIASIAQKHEEPPKLTLVSG